MVEVAALDAESDSSFSSMIQLPRGAVMSDGATIVNKLTTEFMRQPHHPQFEAAYPQFLEFLRQRTEAAGQGGYLLLIGHNIASELTSTCISCSCSCPSTKQHSVLSLTQRQPQPMPLPP